MRRRLPRGLRGIGVRIAMRLLRSAERSHAITLAEEGYADLVEFDHPVFPNHLDGEALPQPMAEGDGRVVYVGDITERRGATDLVEAAGLAGVDVLVVGPVEEVLLRRLRATARQAGIRFESTGRINHPDAMDLVRRASVAVSPLRDDPNTRDSLPTKTLEYAALGLPIVASDLPGTRHALDGLDAVEWFPPGDVNALAEALAATIESGSRPTDRAGEIRSRFPWPSDEVLAFYSDLVEN
jgi:glycosyltransferase involved in cell wall biosynthesis